MSFRTKQRRSPGALAVSIGIHAIAIVVLARVLAMPNGLFHVFQKKPVTLPVDRIGFVSLPSGGPQALLGRSGGNDLPVTQPRRAAGLVAPRGIPVGIPPVPRAPQPAQEEGSGPLVGAGGPLRGLRPSFRDSRLWQTPSQLVTAPKSVRETIEDMIARDVAQFSDSAAAVHPGRDPGDWTFERNGQKYGIDQRYIRLGPVSIPTAVLAMLPLNVQANPSVLDRERGLSYMNRDISYHAQRAISEDEFRRNVRNLRERKDRERAAAGIGQQKERQGEDPAAPKHNPAN